MDKKVLSRDGTPLAYERHGDGPAGVLVGGALCTGATLAPLARALSDRFGAVTYDRRGRGASGDTASPCSVAREVEDIAALIGACGGGAALYGVSSGGALALRAAASGLPVDAVAVYETPFTLHEDGGRRREYTGRLAELLARDRRGDALELFMTLTGMSPEMIAGARRSPGWAGMEAIAPTLAYDDAVMGDGLLPRELPASLPMPVLSVAGGASPAWMRESARAVADAAPRGTYRVLEGQTHAVEAAVLAPLLAEFFDHRGSRP